MKKTKRNLVCVLGHHGFIGSALSKKLSEKHDVTHVPSKNCSIIFDFASPTHEGFEKNTDYNFITVISRMAYLLRFCADHDIKYVFPSSALVYELDRPFKIFKEITEKVQKLFPTKSLALRIFPVYGVGEKRTVIYQWCRDIKMGKKPLVFGDGSQVRDFIYIDDVVDNIIKLSKTKNGVIDLGCGKPYSFNEIVGIISKVAKTKVKTQYTQPPKIYSKGIYCKNPVVYKVSLENGIKKVLESLNVKGALME